MHSIPVSLDVLKALTNRLDSEDQSYDDLLRDLLNLDSPMEREPPSENVLSALQSSLEPYARTSVRLQRGEGFYSRGLFLPAGTQLRARYKGKQYFGRIEGESWLDERGEEHSSPSAAAAAITDTQVNGWRFWEGKLPGSNVWLRLDKLK